VRFTTGVTRWGALLAVATCAAAGAAWWLTGGAIFSPGALSSAATGRTRAGGIVSHADLDRRCGACHSAPLSRTSMSQRCLSCHEAIRGELADSGSLHGALEGASACLACHTEHRGRSASLTRFEGGRVAHERFGFSLAAHPLTADGRPFACGDCHAGRAFRFSGERCLTCHQGYQPEFVRGHIQAWGGDCQACHEGSDRFSRGRFTHDSTGFPLTGGHRNLPCTDCHAGVRTLAGYRGTPSDCAGCHRADDPHRGAFGTDCGACHSTDTWKNARFEHTFPLTHGDGGRIPCRTCHVQTGDYKSYSCYGCHEHSPERIQRKHREEGVQRNLQDCVRCHATGREHEGEGREGRRGEEGDED
jgi:hypothetical protein